MRELHYENQSTNTYLVYAIKEEDSVDSMSLGMLTNNKIHGLAQTLFTQMDSKKYIKFNVSAKVSVAQFFAGAVNKKRLLGVFTGIVNAMLAAEDYMLDPASIIMDMDYIFTDVSTCETDLICIPINDSQAEPVDLGAFFRNIMFNTQFDQTENCDHVAKLINYLNGTPLFSLSDFLNVIEEIEGQKAQPVVKKVSTDTSPTTAASKQAQPVVKQPPVAQFPKGNLSPTNVASGMTVPNAQPRVEPKVEATTMSGPEISFFYLMQHYNKENAAAYKAQKEAKKRATAAAKGQPIVVQPPQKKTPVSTAPPNGFGFTVPGQSTSSQSQSVVSNTSPTQVQVQPVAQHKVHQAPIATSPVPQPAYVPRQAPQGQAANFGETTVLGGGANGETTVLSSVQNPTQVATPHLIRAKNNERIPLNKPVFRIGKERSYVDYFIGDNTAISRSHANIIIRDGKYFVVDTNSTNHTFINGNMIQSNVETEISQGDKIRLANEDFEFKIY